MTIFPDFSRTVMGHRNITWTSRVSAVSRKMASKRCPWNLWICSLLEKIGINLADRIKVANQPILRKKEKNIILDFPFGLDVITRRLKMEERYRGEYRVVWYGRDFSDAAEFEGGCHELRRAGSLQLLRMAAKQIFSFGPPGRNIAFLANSLSPVRPVLEL